MGLGGDWKVVGWAFLDGELVEGKRYWRKLAGGCFFGRGG